MTIRKIIYFPHHCLRRETANVDIVDDEIRTLLDDMFETMYDACGVGLAAPQIGISKKISVIDVTRDKSQQLVLINPEIVKVEGLETMQEGCLSVPGMYDTVQRASKVTFRAMNRDGKIYEMEAEGLLSECVQHEIDHLNGKLFVDLLSPLKRSRIQEKLEKVKRLTTKK